MDKKLIYVIVVVIILGIGGFFVLGNKSAKPPSTPTPPEAQPSATPTSQQSLKDLLTSGGAKKCTFEYKETNSNGSVYIANSKMRGDFQAVSNGQTINSHMIVDGTTSYIWTDNQAMGFKMSMDNMEKPQVTPGAQTQSNVDINQKFNYNCSPWTPDASEFVLPKGVDFKDMSTMMPKTTGTTTTSGGAGTSGSMDKCSACNSLAGDSKAQCLKALSCN